MHKLWLLTSHFWIKYIKSQESKKDKSIKPLSALPVNYQTTSQDVLANNNMDNNTNVDAL